MNHLNDQQERYHFCRAMLILSANKSESTPLVHTATESARLHLADYPRLCVLFLPEQLKRRAKPTNLFSCHCGRANMLLPLWKPAGANREARSQEKLRGPVASPCSAPLSHWTPLANMRSKTKLAGISRRRQQSIKPSAEPWAAAQVTRPQSHPAREAWYTAGAQ